MEWSSLVRAGAPLLGARLVLATLGSEAHATSTHLDVVLLDEQRASVIGAWLLLEREQAGGWRCLGGRDHGTHLHRREGPIVYRGVRPLDRSARRATAAPRAGTLVSGAQQPQAPCRRRRCASGPRMRSWCPRQGLLARPEGFAGGAAIRRPTGLRHTCTPETPLVNVRWAS
jgi:hypothetical protein